jgi:hypothetical protein
VVVENRVGANTVIRSQIVTPAAPDCYTLLLTSGAGYVTNPLTYKNMPSNPSATCASSPCWWRRPLSWWSRVSHKSSCWKISLYSESIDGTG